MAKGFKRWEWYATARASDLSDSAKVVLSAINEHVNEASGKAWPSVATLMRLTGKSESAIHRAMRECRKEGWIITVERPGSTSMNEIALPEGVSLMAPLLKKGGVKFGTPGGATNGTRGVSVLAPEPSLEPCTLNHIEPASGTDVKEEEKQVHLPVAGFDDRVSWSTCWPESEPIPYWETHSEEGRWTRIINVAFDLLGWANKGDNREAFRPIHEALHEGFEYRGVLLDRYTAGELTTVDLANALAVAGISPPLSAAKESSNVEAA